ncbi:glycosyltransferase [bacterium]|nr:glycosyltransferase [bacterium]
MKFEKHGPKIALYSPGMVGLGHIRRNLAIAEVLTQTPLNPAILLIAENREAAAFPIPKGVDCLTLPAYKKDADGIKTPRYLDIELDELIRLRSKIIQAAIEEFNPDVFVVDHLARGAFCELDGTLEALKHMGNTRCVLGLRDIIGDRDLVRATWNLDGTENRIRDYYHSVWVYGDSRICNLRKEYDLTSDVAAKICYTGYLDRSVRLEQAREQNHDPYPGLNLPPGRLVLCLVGGGQDGAHLACTFAMSRLPEDMNGIIVCGPFMAEEEQKKLKEIASGNSNLRILQFIGEPILLLNRADLIIAMGGYNTVSEILSFEKRSLIVPRTKRAPEQSIRADRLQRLGLIDSLPCEQLTPDALTWWLHRTDSGPVRVRGKICMDGLKRLPSLLTQLILYTSGEPARIGNFSRAVQ